MDPKHLHFDSRCRGLCAYCGADPDTVDHVPPKVFLDDPLPEDLATVDACNKCNNRISLDEVKLDFIMPGKPVQNAFRESFLSSFREECLN